ncbi:MAG TPA: polysaccharide biosynthesis protein [Gemmatimonadaceae bacterium]|nr:polysaccharide biosynthesis protein [Gemmatimonadaceae bacterium]
MRRIVRHCLDARVEFKRLPSMRSLLEGGAKAGVLADVQLEHLLVREPVAFDEERVSRNIGGSAVLITGAGGSVGSELTRQIARAKPGKLVLVDQAESALYFIDLEIRRSHPNIEVVPIVADIANRDSTMRLFEEHRPAHVYHAAAYKHVPLMERNIREAVRNNIWGTLSVAECAAAHGARQFVLISTDKAVRPSSVMGATKRVAERIVLGWPSLVRSDTEFRAVRFGNVLGSDGSVVPLFKKQLAHGGPLTVTHPDVRRYFMTIMEAAQLVLHAAVLPDAAGRITMLDMGAQIRILDLAENLVRLSGMEPHRDIQIVFTGLRPGEKIEEELMSAVEQVVPTSAEKVGIVQSDEVDGAAVQQTVERLLIAANCDDVQASLALLRELVPECVPPLMGIGVATQASAPRTRERVARNVAQSAGIV